MAAFSRLESTRGLLPPMFGLLAVLGPALGVAAAPGHAVRRAPASGPAPVVLLETGFEREPADGLLAIPQHQVVSGTARTGTHSLLGEVARENQARTLSIPFRISRGRVLRVSYWVHGDGRTACTAFVRVGSHRIMISAGVEQAPSQGWKQVVATYRPQADTTGNIEINAPSSWQAPPGRMWIDDLSVTDIEDECRFTDHVVDFPAVGCDAKGRTWMATLERPAGGLQIGVYRVDGRQPETACRLAPEKVTGIGAPAIAGTADGCAVAFATERNGAWQIAYALVEAGAASAPHCRFIDGPGTANISPALSRVGSRVCAVWESNGGAARGIYTCWIDARGAGPIQRISSPDVNSYNPSIVALPDGSMLAAWDSVRQRSMNIYGAWCRGETWAAETRLTTSTHMERHANLAVWQGQVWLAWQAQSYPARQINSNTEQRIAVARLDAGGLAAPRHLFEQVSNGTQLLLRPRIAFDKSGRLWLTARQSVGHAGWRPIAWCYSGDQWSAPQVLLEQTGRWRPVNLVATPQGMVAACQFDNIPEGRAHVGVKPDLLFGVTTTGPLEQGAPPARPLEVEPFTLPASDFSLARKMDLCSAELPRQSIQHGEKQLRLYWGNLHEHTDLSVCGRSVNPPGHDLFANARDVERLDFCALTDHDFDFDRPIWAYNGEQTRNNDDPGRFVTFLGEEWTSSSNPPTVPGGPNRYGHHNLIFLDASHGRCYDSYDGDISPADLWKQMQGVEFICIPHELADWQGKGKGNPPTDWNYVDERLQPLAEIFQARQSYEYFGCPRQAPHGAPFQGYYLQDAWAKGIVIGTIASSDHGGGNGKAGVWAERLTRESLFEAMRARHTFGTSGAKMSLFFGTPYAMMGDKVPRTPGPVNFKVQAVSVADVKELVIFRNNQVVYRAAPGAGTFETSWTDLDPPRGTLWYYARIHAADDELAWSSPMWFEAREQ